MLASNGLLLSIPMRSSMPLGTRKHRKLPICYSPVKTSLATNCFGHARIHSPSWLTFLLLVVKIEKSCQFTDVACIAAPSSA